MYKCSRLFIFKYITMSCRINVFCFFWSRQTDRGSKPPMTRAKPRGQGWFTLEERIDNHRVNYIILVDGCMLDKLATVPHQWLLSLLKPNIDLLNHACLCLFWITATDNLQKAVNLHQIILIQMFTSSCSVQQQTFHQNGIMHQPNAKWESGRIIRECMCWDPQIGRCTGFSSAWDFLWWGIGLYNRFRIESMTIVWLIMLNN